jgi:hypothetical protein
VGAPALRGAPIHSNKEAHMKVPLLLCTVLMAFAVVSSAGAVKSQKIAMLEIEKAFTPTGGWSGNSAPSPGQGFIVLSDLYKWKGAARGAWAGTLNASCTFVDVAPNGFSFKAQCNATANLAGGKLSILGQYYGNPSFIPIVGGTGAYTGAKGYVRLLNIGPEDSSNSADTFVITG